MKATALPIARARKSVVADKVDVLTYLLLSGVLSTEHGHRLDSGVDGVSLEDGVVGGDEVIDILHALLGSRDAVIEVDVGIVLDLSLLIEESVVGYRGKKESGVRNNIATHKAIVKDILVRIGLHIAFFTVPRDYNGVLRKCDHHEYINAHGIRQPDNRVKRIYDVPSCMALKRTSACLR
jgi:hypothetical protein